MAGICVDCGVVTSGRGERCRSCAAKKTWADPIFKFERIAAMADPEYRLRLLNGIRLANTDPEVIQRKSEASKRMWEDPEYIESRAATFAVQDIKRRGKR